MIRRSPDIATGSRLLASVLGAQNSDSAPAVLRTGKYARRVIEDFERELEPQLAEHGALGGIADWGSKLRQDGQSRWSAPRRQFGTVVEASAKEIQVATMEAAIVSAAT